MRQLNSTSSAQVFGERVGWVAAWRVCQCGLQAVLQSMISTSSSECVLYASFGRQGASGWRMVQDVPPSLASGSAALQCSFGVSTAAL